MIAVNNVQAFTNTGGQTRIMANQISDQLIAAEAAIDAAVSAVAMLTAQMPLVTQQANLGTHIAQEALMHAMETCQQLVKARTNIIRTHKALRTAQIEIGLGEVAIGDMRGCPDSAELTPQRQIAAVAA
ncbi:hypothetical protein GCM10011529_10650 [Polymorphobacter glacialis]|uniref:Uncharacterized protein n=1 Tax=Sandarakinorhabdus glacialis TaxID=1614636 RepID=A0A916ZNJ3_9SPHN|nr:hypothetical protein [Polymorphobacter glacialis]GGE06132.1 hypothetical protein GCM10011529_10650 [Polymorphobacter glacialis]